MLWPELAENQTRYQSLLLCRPRGLLFNRLGRTKRKSFLCFRFLNLFFSQKEHACFAKINFKRRCEFPSDRTPSEGHFYALDFTSLFEEIWMLVLFWEKITPDFIESKPQVDCSRHSTFVKLCISLPRPVMQSSNSLHKTFENEKRFIDLCQLHSCKRRSQVSFLCWIKPNTFK